MKTYQAFDRKYWDYIAARWPESYFEFKQFCEQRLLMEDFKPWTISPQRQERLIEKFGETSGIYYENPYPFSQACGMVYEWFCTYNLQKGHREQSKVANRQGHLVPEALFDILPDKYKAA